MEENVFYKTDGFQIYEKTRIDPIVWDEPSITSLSEALIASSPAEKKYFYTKSFKGRSGYVLPNYFLHPDDAFDPSDKAATEIFSIVETYTDDTQGLRDFVKKLIDKNVLIRDGFSILKCNRGKCDGITFGGGLHCNKCGIQLKDGSRRRIYSLPRVVKDIFYQPGKIIEGVIYHAIKSISDDDVKIAMNRFFKGVEGSREVELDLVLKNKANAKLLVIHVTTNPKSRTECEQFSRTLSYGIKTIFVTTELDSNANILKDINKTYENKGIILWDIINDSKFFDKINKEIKDFIL